MIFENPETNKEKWVKNEKHIKIAIIGVIIAALFLIVVIIFFRTKIWAIITGLAVIAGLIGDLFTIFNSKKGG